MYAPGPGLSFVSMPKLVLRLALEKNPPSDNLFTEIKVYWPGPSPLYLPVYSNLLAFPAKNCSYFGFYYELNPETTLSLW